MISPASCDDSSRHVGGITRRASSGLLLLLLLLLTVSKAEANEDAEHQREPRTTGSSDGNVAISFVGDASAEDTGNVNQMEPMSPEAMHVDWLVDVGACSGVLIAPTFVLTSAGCTEQSSKAGVVESVQLWVTKENENATSIGVPIARELQAVTIDGTSSSAVRAHSASAFVILELSEEAPVRPVVLESPAESWKNEVNLLEDNWRVRLVGAWKAQDDGAEGSRFAVNARRDDGACSVTQDEVLCVVASVTCKAIRSVSVRDPVFLVAQHSFDEDQDMRLIGVSRTDSFASCRDSAKPGSSVIEFLPVTSLAELTNLYGVDHKWTTSPTDMSGFRDASSGDSDDTSVGEESGTHQQLPELLAEFPELGCLRVANETARDFGAYVVLIAPRFVLTRAQWLIKSRVTSSSLNQTELQVGFITETIPVKSIIFQNEQQEQGVVQFEDDNNDADLVVLELAFEVSIAPSRILATSLQLDTVSSRSEVVVLDATSEPEEGKRPRPIPGTIKDMALTSCLSTATQTSSLEFVCANAPHFAHHAPPSILNQGILRVNGLLVGFSASPLSQSPSTGSKVYERYQFTRLSSKRHVQFLANATQSTAVLKGEEKDDIVEELKPGVDFPSFIATFSAAGVHDKVIHCQGMLVAPKFVLTTASCALENPISEIRFHFPSGDMVRVAYSPQMTIPHPKYNRSALAADERFDIAILELEFAVMVVPATLSLGGGLTNETSDGLIGFQVSIMNTYLSGQEALYVSRVAFNRSAKCSTRGVRDSGSSLPARLQVSVCITPSWNSPEEGAAVFSPPPFPEIGTPGFKNGHRGMPDPVVGDPEAPLLPGESENGDVVIPPPSLNGSLVGKLLNNSRISMVGFAVAQEISESSGEVYSISSVADFAVFINAYVVGASWESGGLTVDGPLQISKQYIVGLRVSKTGQNFCGGSLIAPSYVLTAAHCVTDGLANWVSVGSSSSSGESSEVIPIITKSIVIHHKYGFPSQFSFDAAIFELKSPAYADPVKLDKSPDFASGERATMYGYGIQSQSSSNMKILSSEIHAVDLSLLSQAQCKVTLPDIDRSMLCAVGNNGADACKGDSGGPLVVPESRSNQDVLVGFVSSGYDCGLKNVPGIYMRVSSLTKFIKDNTVGAAWSTVAVSQQPQQTPAVSPSTPSLTPSTDSEFRDLDDPMPSKSPTSVESSSDDDAEISPAITTSQSSKSAPIRVVDLPSGLKPQVRDAVLLYLLGISSDSDFFISSAFLKRLAQEDNEIRFFSSGNLSHLLEILKRHNNKPLYARTDRFKRRKTGTDALRQETISKRNGVSDSTVCTP